MFDRSACARVRIATDAHADLAALTTLATLLQHVLKDYFASSKFCEGAWQGGAADFSVRATSQKPD